MQCTASNRIIQRLKDNIAVAVRQRKEVLTGEIAWNVIGGPGMEKPWIKRILSTGFALALVAVLCARRYACRRHFRSC